MIQSDAKPCEYKFETDIGIIWQARKSLVGNGWSNAIEPPKGTWIRSLTLVAVGRIGHTNAGSQLEERQMMSRSSITIQHIRR